MRGGLSVEEVYRRHGHVVQRRAGQILGNDADAREIVQDLFTSLVERPEQFDGRSSIVTWLYSATTHLCLNRIRDGNNRARLLDERVIPAAGASAPPTAERSVLVRQLLAQLPDDLATAAVHYYVDEMSHEEIAALMGCSRRHVGNLIERVERWSATPEGEACTAS